LIPGLLMCGLAEPVQLGCLILNNRPNVFHEDGEPDYGNTMGLESDGPAVAVGNNVYGQCNVGGWDLN
jgi:hypothetical protein